MELLYTLAMIAGAAIAVFALLKIIAAPIKKIFKLLLNAVSGLLLLLLANVVSGFFDFAIPINLMTCLIAGGLGIPGVILIVMVILFIA